MVLVQGKALRKKFLRSLQKVFLALAAVNMIFTLLALSKPCLDLPTGEGKVFGGCPFFKKGKVLSFEAFLRQQKGFLLYLILYVTIFARKSVRIVGLNPRASRD